MKKIMFFVVILACIVCFAGGVVADEKTADNNYGTQIPNLMDVVNIPLTGWMSEPFRALTLAYDTIMEFESKQSSDYYGQFGHPKYLAAVKAIIPEGLERGSEGYKAVLTLYKKYLKAEAPLKCINNFASDMEKAAIAINCIDPATGEITANTEQIAAQMGITDEACIAMLYQVNLYVRPEDQFELQ